MEAIKEAPDAEMCAEVNGRLLEVFNIARAMPELTMSAIPSKEQSREAVTRIFQELREEAGPVYGDILRYFLLEALDRCWKDHLRAMDYLREGIGLRGYAQRDPKREYQSEGLAMFKEMLFRIHEGALTSLTHVRMRRVEAEETEAGEAAEGAEAPVDESPAAEEAQEAVQEDAAPEEKPAEEPAKTPEAKAEPALNLRHKTDPAAMGGPAPEEEEHHTYNGVKVGRNDPCPCGSGKKFKKCCGRNL